MRILDTGFRRCDEVLYGIRGDCPVTRIFFSQNRYGYLLIVVRRSRESGWGSYP